MALSDCTHTRSPRSRRRLLLGLIALATLFGLTASWATPARGDGDPASDVLALQSLFLPQDTGVSPTQQTQLQQLLRESQRTGYQIRVALIASATDLGSVTELWRQPKTYAQFLAQELGVVYHGPLLVLMPNGVGFHQPQRRFAPQPRLPSGVRTLVPGSRLGTAAITAIRELASASGHPLPLPIVHARRTSAARTVEDIVFVVGLLICIVAWILSALDRPPRIRRNRSAPAE